MEGPPLLARLIRDAGREVRDSIELALREHLATAITNGVDNAPCPICGSVETMGDSDPVSIVGGTDEMAQAFSCRQCESTWAYVYRVIRIVDVALADGTPVQ